MKKVITVILVLILLVISVIFTIDMMDKKYTKNAQKTDTSVASTQSTTEVATPTELTTELTTELPSDTTEATTEEPANMDRLDSNDPSFPQSFELELELINQFPELPAGCEAVSLTMILNYYGFDLDKSHIIDNYQVFSDNFVLGYCGDPYSATTGGGCYAPGMTDTANNFLKDKESPLRAKNITGTEFEELFEYVAAGNPVMVWTTMGMAQSSKGYYQYDNLGNAYAWDNMEHCVVLAGYDLEANTVIIYDPMEGIMTRDLDLFKASYESMYKMSIILKEY